MTTHTTSEPVVSNEGRQQAVGARSEIVLHARRIRYESAYSFDELLARFQLHIGKTVPLREMLDVPDDLAAFEASIHSIVGDSDFVSFAPMELTSWVARYGIKRKMLRWVVGNPLIAITMVRHDQTASLYVPIEMLLQEGDEGTGSSVTFMLPSSVIATGENKPLLEAALALDRKFETLVASVV